jgi:hypothetical protein
MFLLQEIIGILCTELRQSASQKDWDEVMQLVSFFSIFCYDNL